MRLGIIPSPEEIARVVAWLVATVLYASFWLAFALLLSVVVRGRGVSAALVGFGTWLGLILFGSVPAADHRRRRCSRRTRPELRQRLFASTPTQQLFLRISPATLYGDIGARCMNPTVNSVLGVGNMGQAIELPAAAADAAVARPVDPRRLAADRAAGGADRRHVRAGLRPVPAPGGPRVASSVRPPASPRRHASGCRFWEPVIRRASLHELLVNDDEPDTLSRSGDPKPPGHRAAPGGRSPRSRASWRPAWRSPSASSSPASCSGRPRRWYRRRHALIDFAPPGSKEVVVVAVRDQRQARPHDPRRRGRAARRGRHRAARPAQPRGRLDSPSSRWWRWARWRPSATRPRRRCSVALSALLQVASGSWRSSGCWGPTRRRGLPDRSTAPGAAGGEPQRHPAADASREFLVRAGVLGALAFVGQVVGRSMLNARAANTAKAGVAIPTAVDPAPSVGPDDAFAIDGHHAARRSPTTPSTASTPRSSTPSVDLATWSLRVHGMVDREVTLTFDQLLAAAAHRALRHHRLRQQRGRRRPHRQRQVDRRPAHRRAGDGRRPGGRDPDRAPLRGRLGGRLPHLLGHGPGAAARRAHRREDERRAAARRPRVPGAAHRPRAVRLRLGHQVAHRDRAHDARGVRRLLGAARLGQGGARS